MHPSPYLPALRAAARCVWEVTPESGTSSKEGEHSVQSDTSLLAFASMGRRPLTWQNGIHPAGLPVGSCSPSSPSGGQRPSPLVCQRPLAGVLVRVAEAPGPPMGMTGCAQELRTRPSDRPQLSPHRLLGPCLQLGSVFAARSVWVWDGPQGWHPSPTATKREPKMNAKATVRRALP